MRREPLVSASVGPDKMPNLPRL